MNLYQFYKFIGLRMIMKPNISLNFEKKNIFNSYKYQLFNSVGFFSNEYLKVCHLYNTTHLPHYIEAPDKKIIYPSKPILDQLKLCRKWYSTSQRLLLNASALGWCQNSVSSLLIVCPFVCPSIRLSVCYPLLLPPLRLSCS